MTWGQSIRRLCAVSHGGSYEEVVERARAAARAKRLSGGGPEGTGAALDRIFLEVAPGGARPEGEGLEAVVDMLGRYRYDPAIALSSGPGLRGMVAGLAKRALRPGRARRARRRFTVWPRPPLPDQLTASPPPETSCFGPSSRPEQGPEQG